VYTAFISYCHEDAAASKWLHSALESYIVPSDLVGRETARGKLKSHLRPIFRDREDFAAGHSLTEQTVAALNSSEALIVLCSASSAKSHYVNEEVRLFKAARGSRPIIPVVLEAEPATPVASFFAPALKFKVLADGTLTSDADELLAADLREGKDGRELSLLKIVAGLTGVPLDDIRKRDAITYKRRVAKRAAALVVVLALAMLSGYLTYRDSQARSKEAELSRKLDAFSQRLLLVSPAMAGPGAERAIREALSSCEDHQDARLCRARDLLSEGRKQEAAEIYASVAAERERSARRVDKDAALAYRNLGTILGLSDPKGAREAFANAVRLDSDDREALYWHAWLQLQAGDTATAEREFMRLLKLGNAADDKLALFRAHLRLADVSMFRTRSTEAYAHVRTALDAAILEAAQRPEDADWKRNSAIAVEKLGDILLRTGDLRGALANYQSSLKSTEDLLQSSSDNVLHVRDVFVIRNKIGDALLQLGKTAEALSLYKDGLSKVESLAAGDPKNAGWQRDLSISLERVAGPLGANGDTASAVELLKRAHDLRSSLVVGDRSNLGLQRDVAVSSERLGGLLLARDEVQPALTLLRDSLSIRSKLSLIDPANLEWERDLSVSHERLGDALVTKGEFAAAQRHFAESHAIRDKLFQSDRGNLRAAFDLGVSYYKLALVAAQLGSVDAQRSAMKAALDIVVELVRRSPDNQEWTQALKTIETEMARIN
jgi:tetratricopeptide (TPR) repeat protein